MLTAQDPHHEAAGFEQRVHLSTADDELYRDRVHGRGIGRAAASAADGPQSVASSA